MESRTFPGSRHRISLSHPAIFGACSSRATAHFGLARQKGLPVGRMENSLSTLSLRDSLFLDSSRIVKAGCGSAEGRLPLGGSARFRTAASNAMERTVVLATESLVYMRTARVISG